MGYVDVYKKRGKSFEEWREYIRPTNINETLWRVREKINFLSGIAVRLEGDDDFPKGAAGGLYWILSDIELEIEACEEAMATSTREASDMVPK